MNARSIFQNELEGLSKRVRGSIKKTYKIDLIIVFNDDKNECNFSVFDYRSIINDFENDCAP